MTEIFYGKFNDSAVYDGNNKTVVSLRDGVLIYLGSELGLEPSDKEFKIYRSPATIAKAGLKMINLPITDGHVEVGGEVTASQGNVKSSDIVDFNSPDQDSRLAIKNKVTISDYLDGEVSTGKREASLGYTAELVKHEQYDFEQRDIEPHHLAVVETGRCGPGCSFLDSKPIIKKENSNMATKLHKMFVDEDGKMNLSRIVEVMTALPEAIKQVPLEQVMKVMPALEEIINAVRSQSAPAEETDMSEGETTDTNPGEEEESMNDEEKENKKFGDKAYRDEQIKRACNEHAVTVLRAREFFDSELEQPEFEKLSTFEIQKITVERFRPDQKFKDSEIPVAFKMLNHQPTVLPSDVKKEGFNELADKTY